MVFVLDKDKEPLTPCCSARARILLREGRAAVFRRYPFTIIMKDRTVKDSAVKEYRVKIDPGSKTTGMAVVEDDKVKPRIVFAAELEHRGELVKKRMDGRRGIRQCRRDRKTRYRAVRFLNRTRKPDWFPPSRESRVSNIVTWINRIRRFCPVSALSMELVKFDLQKMENPEIAGVEYQRGTLFEYEVKGYLLEKWGRKCSYCGKEGVPLQKEHILARVNGGTNRVSNLCLACERCNNRKGKRTVQDFLKKKSTLLKKILAQAKTPLKDATAVNATRWALFRRLKETGIPIECGSGGRTKWNRTCLGLEKSHWTDAACVGKSAPEVGFRSLPESVLKIKACGHGNRQMCATDKYGFPRQHRSQFRGCGGFRTGDVVKVIGRRIVGRVMVRRNGVVRIGDVYSSIRRVKLVQRSDGYSFK